MASISITGDDRFEQGCPTQAIDMINRDAGCEERLDNLDMAALGSPEQPGPVERTGICNEVIPDQPIWIGEYPALACGQGPTNRVGLTTADRAHAPLVRSTVLALTFCNVTVFAFLLIAVIATG